MPDSEHTQIGERANLTHGPSAELSLVRTLNLIFRVACALVVCRISGSRIGNAELSSVWIRLHWLINMELLIQEVDFAICQQLVGHSDLETTMACLEGSDDAASAHSQAQVKRKFEAFA